MSQTDPIVVDEPSGDPSIQWGAIGAAIGALVTLLTAFGIALTEEQVEAILGAVATVGPLVTALLIRRRAYKPDTVRALLAQARDAYHGTDQP